MNTKKSFRDLGCGFRYQTGWTGREWTGTRFFIPELAYGLIAGAAIGIGWSAIYTVMN